MATNMATNSAASAATNLDVVCGMKVEEDQAVGISEYLGRTYYFCSEDCKHKFEQRPESYVVKTSAGTAGVTVTDDTE